MLTKEQKLWIIIGHCMYAKCSELCQIREQCNSFEDDFDHCTDAELNACLKIITPNVLEAVRPKWISVADKLPETFKPVIVCREYKKGTPKVEQGYRDVNGWWKVFGCRVKSVSHWMPLPEPPEEERK